MANSTAKIFKESLETYKDGFHPVVPVQESDRIVALDFTDSNKDLTAEVLCNTGLFTEYVNKLLAQSGATYGIGGYNEHRTIYSRSHVFDTPGGEEPRRLHLGTDIWGPAGTPVYAPLPAIVHSFAFNDAFGDYGATLILQHDVDGFIFHTLFGHLSLASIQNIQEGQAIEKGQWIAAFGAPAENGQWPPHLHFQVVVDMQNWKGDYPGVCRFSEREQYLANSPDPDTLLHLNKVIYKL